MYLFSLWTHVPCLCFSSPPPRFRGIPDFVSALFFPGCCHLAVVFCFPSNFAFYWLGNEIRRIFLSTSVHQRRFSLFLPPVLLPISVGLFVPTAILLSVIEKVLQWADGAGVFVFAFSSQDGTVRSRLSFSAPVYSTPAYSDFPLLVSAFINPF